MDCRKCQKYATCKKLCDRAEAFVSKDHVAQRELTYKPVNDKADADMNLPLDNIAYSPGAFPYTHAEMFTFYNASREDWKSEILTKEENNALYWHLSQGISYRQIAFRLSGNRKPSYSVGKVKNLIHGAKEKLKKYGKEKGIGK